MRLTFAIAAAILAVGVLTPAALPQPRPGAREFTIARLKYGGGGDWYEDRTSLVNLLRGVRDRMKIPVAGEQETVVEPGAAAVPVPFVFACGHGNMKPRLPRWPTCADTSSRWLPGVTIGIEPLPARNEEGVS
jgi:hypothetical protein